MSMDWEWPAAPAGLGDVEPGGEDAFLGVLSLVCALLFPYCIPRSSRCAQLGTSPDPGVQSCLSKLIGRLARFVLRCEKIAAQIVSRLAVLPCPALLDGDTLRWLSAGTGGSETTCLVRR